MSRQMPIINRRTRVSGLFIVISQEFRLHFYTLGEPALQGLSNSSMEQLPGFLEECAVGSLLYQSVLEEVFRSGDLALFENEPRSDKKVECIPQLAVRSFDGGP